MKKLLLSLLLFAALNTYAQTDTISVSVQKQSEALGHGGNNELKINLLFSVIGMPEISYERLLADNMGLGLSVLFGLDDEIDYNFGLIPHYRVYFGSKKANGFFIEGNMSLLATRNDRYDYYFNGQSYSNNQSNLAFGLGAAAGAKFLTRNGFLGEVYLGVGRTLGEKSIVEAYPRIGITIGKRF